MAATIKIGPWEATCDGYHWTGAHKPLVDALNASLDPDGPSGSDPNPDLNAARAAAKTFGGEVLRFDKSAHVAGRVY